MYKKFLVSLAATLIAFSGIFSNLTLATESENNTNDFSQNEVDAVAKELQFYFEEIGHLDENGNYYIHDYERLNEKAKTGDETAQGLIAQINYEDQNQIGTQNLEEYVRCILAEQFSTEIALVSGDLVNSVMGAIEDGAWQVAARIVLESIGGVASNANIVALASQLAIYSAYCGGQQV